MNWRRHWVWVSLLATLGPTFSSKAQIDPEKRRLFQVGYDQPLRGHGPLGVYAYYFHNQPDFHRTNLTLRLAVAPVYMDSEIGWVGAFGPYTDLGIGLAGGGHADSYAEIRRGKFVESESYTGHGAGTSATVYHLFNPYGRIPLNGLLRGAVRYAFYAEDSETDDAFDLPAAGTRFHVRTGLRWGGREPFLFPSVAAELSGWYEGQFRLNEGAYGFAGDREVEEHAHLFWARALVAYTLPQSGHYFETSLSAGTTLNTDRFSAYRLGGNLPLISEFPLSIPGYYSQELSAKDYVLLQAKYFLPLDGAKRWALGLIGSAAFVEYLDDFEQAGNFHPGIGGGILYQSKSRAWQFALAYSYGFQAVRGDDRGGHSITLVAQYDLEAERRAGVTPFWQPMFDPETWRGVVRIFGGR